MSDTVYDNGFVFWEDYKLMEGANLHNNQNDKKSFLRKIVEFFKNDF